MSTDAVVARFHFEKSTPVEVTVHSNGQLGVPPGAPKSGFRRFELLRAGKLHFWTNCRAPGSKFSVAGETLTIDYPVRNALFQGAKFGAAGVFALLNFKLKAQLDRDRAISVESLYVQFDRDTNLWLSQATPSLRWPVKSELGSTRIPVLFGMGLDPHQIHEDKGSYQPSLTIRRVSRPDHSTEQFRVEFLLAFNHCLKVKGTWPGLETAGVFPPLGPRVRLRTGGHLDEMLELALDLSHNPVDTKVEFSLLQTDPWDPPIGVEAGETWRQFEIVGLATERVLASFNTTVTAAVAHAGKLVAEAEAPSFITSLRAIPGERGGATGTLGWLQQDRRPDAETFDGRADFGRVRDVRLFTTRPFQVEAEFVGVHSDAGRVIYRGTCQFHVSRNAGFCSRVELDNLQPTGSFNWDVGGIRMSTMPASMLRRLACDYGLSVTSLGIGPALQRPELKLTAELESIAVRPIGRDASIASRYAGQIDTSGVLLVAGEAAAAIPSNMKVVEQLRHDHSRRLSLELMARPGLPGLFGAEAQTVVLLRPHPLFVGQVRFAIPTGRAAETNAYASWTLSGPAPGCWQFRSPSARMTLILPPQGVGEAYERRHDIVDLPINYRLAPLARLDLELRDEERAFNDLPWDIDAVLGQPQDLTPGPALTSARFELLYGLETTLLPLDVRLASDETRRGAIPPRLAEDRLEEWPETFARQWNSLHQAYVSRILPLQPYRPFKPEAPRFDDGSELRQRLRLPAPGEPSSADWADLDPEPYLKADPSRTGLRGGATLGFESKRIYEAVLLDRQSTSGEITGVHWTALGGSGQLKARFDHDRSIIEARVDLGRVSHYAVERIGRIGVFWNRAKHVIVYERSTHRRPRYAAGDDAQTELAGWPVVRKVNEYVELLEPERRFAPADAASAATGFVQGLKFPDRIIPVSSLWGEDVGDISAPLGWKVPLWRRTLPGDPSPLTKPVICLIASGQAQDEEHLHTIVDPENLFFYTDTQLQTGADTDRWPAVEGVDFVDVAVELDSNSLGFDDALGVARPSAPALPFQLSPCSWHLENNAEPVNLVAGRGHQPVSTRLRNVTLMRRANVPAETADTSRAMRAWLVRWNALRHEVRLTIQRGTIEGWNGTRWDAERSRLTQEMLALRSGLTGKISQFLNQQACELLAKEAKRPLQAMRREVQERIETEQARAQAQVLALTGDVGAQLARLAGEFVQGVNVLADAGGQVHSQIEQVLVQALAVADEMQAHALAALGQARQEVNAVLAELGHAIDLSAYRLRIVRAQQALEGLRTSLIPVLTSLRKACDQVASRWNGGIGSAIVDLPAWARELQSRCDLALQEAQLKLKRAAHITNDLDLALQTVIAGARREIDQVHADLTTHTSRIRAEIDGGLAQVTGHVDQLSQEYGKVLALLRVKIDDVHRNLTETIDPHAFLALLDAGAAALTSAVNDEVNSANQSIGEYIENSVCPLLPTADRLATLTAQLDELAGVIDALGNNAQELLAAAWQGFSDFADDATDWLEHVGRSLGESLRTVADAPLSLLRAFGEPPKLPELSFNREWLEYIFRPGELRIDLSPVTAFFSELGDELKGLSLNLPSIGLDPSGLVPATLREFDLNAVFGNLGGIKLPGLLSRVKLPDLDRDAVRITHGFDRKKRRAWVQADVTVPYQTNPVLFEAMGLTMRLVKPKLTAQSRLEPAAEGKPGFYAKGEVASTLRLEFSGQPLADLRDATIRFDDRGRFDFDFSPDRIDFKAGLRFIADLIRTRRKLDADPEKEAGFVPTLIEHDGVPVGVRTVLELDPGPLNFGAFALDGLVMTLAIELLAKPEGKIAMRLGLASPDKPFVLSVGLLGGGGWLTASAGYFPAKGLVESEVDIAIAVGRVFSVAFGPIRGMAQVVFGVNARFISRGSRSRFSLIVFFLFSGNFRLWGIVTVGLYLRLEIEYQSSGSLVGRGVVHITIKIGRFFKRTVRQRVTYQFAGQPALASLTNPEIAVSPRPGVALMPQGVHAAPTYVDRARAYLARYED